MSVRMRFSLRRSRGKERQEGEVVYRGNVEEIYVDYNDYVI